MSIAVHHVLPESIHLSRYPTCSALFTLWSARLLYLSVIVKSSTLTDKKSAQSLHDFSVWLLCMTSLLAVDAQYVVSQATPGCWSNLSLPLCSSGQVLHRWYSSSWSNKQLYDCIRSWCRLWSRRTGTAERWILPQHHLDTCLYSKV